MAAEIGFPRPADPLGEANDLAASLGATSVVITHDMHSVLQIADRAGFIHDRRLHWHGTLADLHCCADPEVLAFVKASEYTIGAEPKYQSAL